MRAGPVGTASCFDARPDVTGEWGHDCSRTEFRYRHRCRCLRRRALGRGRSVPADRTVPDAMGRRGCPTSLTGGRSGCGPGGSGRTGAAERGGTVFGACFIDMGTFSEKVEGRGRRHATTGGRVLLRRATVGRERPGKGRRAGSGRQGGVFFGRRWGGRGGAERRFHLPMYRRFGLLWPADCSGERMRVPYSDRPRLGRRVRPSFGKRGSTISHRHIDRYGRTGKRKGEAAASPFRGSLSLPAKGRRQSVVRIIWR